MLISAGRVPKQCLRLVQVFLPPIGTVKSAHFPGLVWQFNHLQKRCFWGPRLTYSLQWNPRGASAGLTQAGIQRSKPRRSTLGPFSLNVHSQLQGTGCPCCLGPHPHNVGKSEERSCPSHWLYNLRVSVWFGVVFSWFILAPYFTSLSLLQDSG